MTIWLLPLPPDSSAFNLWDLVTGKVVVSLALQTEGSIDVVDDGGVVGEGNNDNRAFGECSGSPSNRCRPCTTAAAVVAVVETLQPLFFDGS